MDSNTQKNPEEHVKQVEQINQVKKQSTRQEIKKQQIDELNKKIDNNDLNLNYFILRYGEIGTKSRQTMHRFERLLAKNIKSVCEMHNFKVNVYLLHTRLLVATEEQNTDKLKDLLARTPGIVSFSPCTVIMEPTIEKIKEKAFEEVEKRLNDKNNNNNKNNNNKNNNNTKETTFRIKTQRMQKKFPMNSLEVNMAVGGEMGGKYNLKVDLVSPDISIDIELLNDYSFIFSERFEGIGGLPVGTQGKVLVLTSDGIDSPVSAFMMAKRGCKLVLLHMKTSEEGSEKVQKLVEILKDYDPSLKYIEVDFKETLGDIKDNLIELKKEKYTCVFCKRKMLKIAEKFAYKYKCDAVVNGDNMGQVASQTLKNLRVISSCTNLQVLRPLIGFDKVEIMRLADKIGTLKISTSKELHCFAVPKFPATDARENEINNIEELLLKKESEQKEQEEN
ncbi:thiamine biosynthesis protein ThiI [Methanococcus voltae PS]|uniref:Probable tRNA sulfurtransferase n=1 Tax=Methanococcus voltae PS TaxID=523842 RepID=A0ABT2EWP7_METVO|nr:thiamine biosynthesis protein ThiI [Methanococcus voltae PS]